MTPLLSCQSLSKSIGGQILFENIDLVIHQGDRVGLIGPNGSGKSTLLRILCQRDTADTGMVSIRKHSHVSFVAQADDFQEEKSATDNLYFALSRFDLNETEQYNRVHALLSRAEFKDPDCPVRLLSGGWRKRLAICMALVTHADLLVMDEPTNHLDIEGILWLEKMLNARFAESPAAFLLVSHDRRFLENTVNRVVELSRSYSEGFFQVNGSYSVFLEKRALLLDQQHKLEERLANKVRRETEWLRRGPKARATKARYRSDQAYRLQDELARVQTRNRTSSRVGIEFDSTGRKTRKLLEATGIGKQYDGRTLFSKLNLTLSPGVRLGLVGRNGCGKSTLMKILAACPDGHGLMPDEGRCAVADGVRVVSFDQKREQLDRDVTLRSALAPDGDSVVYRDRSLHVASWAKRFLFRADQLETPVGRLSGGEQARILIAGLMLQPADILLLDEPTNDLDIPSQDVLAESLDDFPGALVLVSHDRFLLDSLCNTVLGFDGSGGVNYFADCDQWLTALPDRKKKQQTKKVCAKTKSPEKKTGKLTYNDQREYDSIEEKIQAAESELERLQQLMDAPETVSSPELLAQYWEETRKAEKLVEHLYERWEILEGKKEGR